MNSNTAVRAGIIVAVVAILTLLTLYGIIPRDVLIAVVSALVGYGGGRAKNSWGQKS